MSNHRDPGKLYMVAADQVLRYLCGTNEKGILFSHGVKHANLLWGWVDADWAGPVTPIPFDLIPALSSCSMADPSA
jgi:hypothetical protein